jgi:methylthioribose-1-phosphate isomerase
MRAIGWVNERITAIEQALPDVLTSLWIETVDQLIDAIEWLAIHGVRALGVAGARGVTLAVGNGGDICVESAGLRAARPTVMNLAWGVDRVLARLDAVVAGAVHVLEDDVRCNRDLEFRCAKWLVDRLGGPVNMQTQLQCGCVGVCRVGVLPSAWYGHGGRPTRSAMSTWMRRGR